MRTAEHMEHRNLERKWRPSFALGPHLTEGRSIDERRRLSWLFFLLLLRLHGRGKSKKIVYARRLWGPRGFIARDPLNRKRGFDETASRLSNLTPSKNKQLFVYVSTRRVPQTI